MSEAYVNRDELLQRVTEQAATIAEQAATIVVQAGLITTLETQLSTLVGRVAELKQRSPPPSWVKPNRPQASQPRPARKQRRQNFARKRETPSETVIHQAEQCPDCGGELSAGQVVGRRQVLDVPLLPATVTEHVVVRRRCKQCGQTVAPTLDLSASVLGQQRVSIRLMALITQLREQLRLPIRLVQQYLAEVHGLHLSVGELVAVLQTVAARGAAAVASIQTAMQTSDWVHADETGWRENGHSGYIWSYSTPSLRYYVHGGRHKEMLDAALGPDFGGVLVTDFYGAYDHYPGPHQRCWVHLLRDIDELQQKQPEDVGLARWAKQVRRVYDAASSDPGPAARLEAGEQTAWRRKRQRHYEQALHGVCLPFVGKAVPQRVLCERVQKFLPELFTFVADPRVPADNNAAERSVRPVAVRRKISGGTRSAVGTLTRTTLWSLLETWALQGKRALDGWCNLLRQPAGSLV